MHDELYCEAELPDAVPAGTIFETTTFPHPFLYRYRITKAGRLIDACGRDLECDGYLEFFYFSDRSVGNCKLAEYRAHFCRGQLNSIVRAKDEPEGADVRVIYGLASYRNFALGVPSSFMSNTDEDVETPEELRSIEPKLTLEQKLALSDPGEVNGDRPCGQRGSIVVTYERDRKPSLCCGTLW